MSRRRPTALKVGDEFDAAVRDLTSAGLGVVAHPSGRVCFVPGVWPGERGTFAITALKGRSGEARVVELVAPSPERVTPPCARRPAWCPSWNPKC